MKKNSDMQIEETSEDELDFTKDIKKLKNQTKVLQLPKIEQ